MGTLWHDLRFGLRMLWKKPGVTWLVIVALGLGIGANTAIFSVVDGVLLRPLPFKNASRLVMVYEEMPKMGFLLGTFSAPDYEDVVRQNHVFEGTGAYRHKNFELSGVKQPERISGLRITASLFPVLGVHPALGRPFTEGEDKNAALLVILSYGFWQREFGGDRAILGRPIVLDRVPRTVIGVMPRGFEFPLGGNSNFNGQPADLFVPMSFTPAELQGLGNMYNHSAIARLRPGVAVDQAVSEIDLILHRFQSQFPAVIRQDPNFELDAKVMPLRQAISGPVQRLLLVLLAAVGMVLLIACADVSNLLLTRAVARHREMAVRAAMGASRMRLARQVITESLVLALAGGACGLLIAQWGTVLLVRLAPSGLPLVSSSRINPGVLGFTFVLCMATAVLFGLAPALHASRTDLTANLKAGGRSGTATRGHRRLLGGLVAAQFALALVLLTGAGLLLRSFARLLATDPGFQPENVLSLRTSLPGATYTNATQIRSFYRRLIDRVSALPGVRSVAEATCAPLDSCEHDIYTAEGSSAGQHGTNPDISVVWVMGSYFTALRIPLIKGRLFGPQDVKRAQRVMVINQAMARRFWPNQDPIGRRVKNGSPEMDVPWMTVVGVIGNVKNGDLNEATLPQAYIPYEQVDDKVVAGTVVDEFRSLTLMTQTQNNPAALLASIRSEIGQLDPALPVSDAQTMQQLIHRTVKPQRFNMFLLVIFAVLALVLAAVGIYGVMAYAVSQRTNEIGIRIALGAQASEMLKMVLTEGMRLALVGIFLGLVAALGLTRLIASLLYGVTPDDPATFCAVAVLLIGVALAACYLPARRATKVDPMVALRQE